MWRHITKRSAFPGICLYIVPGIFLLTTGLDSVLTLYRNFSLRRGYSRASVNKVRGAIRMEIDVPRSWTIRAGQHINIWFPSVGFRAWSETHPFMIVSWTVSSEWKASDSDAATLASWSSPDGGLTTIQLLIEPRDGFTRRLLRYAETTPDTDRRLVLFSGPHGVPATMGDYGSVLMVASGFGIAAHLPYIKELLDGFQACKVVTRRVHLVWQLKEQGKSNVSPQ